jgi:hypothetical protein
VSGADEGISYAANIKPLFRSGDRQAMKFAFDLWSYDDVKANGEAILDRLSDGSMPCDAAWPAENVALFERWLRSGAPG